MEIMKHEFYDHQFTPWKDGKRTHERNWNAVRGWNKAAETWCPKCGTFCFHLDWKCRGCGNPCRCPLSHERPRVFCASLADWLDPEVPVEWLADLLALIHECPNLDFLLLTKRPGLWAQRMKEAAAFFVDDRRKSGFGEPEMWAFITGWMQGNAPANVWIGTTVEDQRRADERIPELLDIPSRIRFLSCEPLLGPVDIARAFHAAHEEASGMALMPSFAGGKWPGLNWVIVGGESGTNARPMHPDWARGLRDQCDAAEVPFFFKQWGEWASGAEIYGKDKTMFAWENGYICESKPMGKMHVRLNRIGKHRAGRLLDGREHSAFPEVRS